MATVYILYSDKLDRFYVGSCLDLKKRLVEHLSGKFGGFPSRSNDWIIFYSIDSLGQQQARCIERHIKNMKSRSYYKNLKRYPEIAERLKEKYME